MKYFLFCKKSYTKYVLKVHFMKISYWLFGHIFPDEWCWDCPISTVYKLLYRVLFCVPMPNLNNSVWLGNNNTIINKKRCKKTNNISKQYRIETSNMNLITLKLLKHQPSRQLERIKDTVQPYFTNFITSNPPESNTTRLINETKMKRKSFKH